MSVSLEESSSNVIRGEAMMYILRVTGLQGACPAHGGPADDGQ